MLFSDHIKKLCNLYGIKIKTNRNLVHVSDGKANKKLNQIEIAPIVCCLSYVMALHEIGHLKTRWKAPLLESEELAWDWASENAIVWNEEMAELRRACLKSYLSYSARVKRAIKPRQFASLG